ncbi:MAG: hypothetical protein UX64_C0001G0010 [Microgenomates group bacterium GW2011_GWC2_46_7]|nr:MAG: hypothetical protein UX64_C0001G0010 [Microgenomates group bacterium GW2011_GWC2_46_7]
MRVIDLNAKSVFVMGASSGLTQHSHGGVESEPITADASTPVDLCDVELNVGQRISIMTRPAPHGAILWLAVESDCVRKQFTAPGKQPVDSIVIESTCFTLVPNLEYQVVAN